jgi:hypothetical protein
MDKSKRKNQPGSNRLWRLGWTILIMIPVSALLLIVVFGGRFFDTSTEINADGEQAAQWASSVMGAELPDSARGIIYHEVRYSLDPYQATIEFSAPPEDYRAFIERAKPFCFATPLKPEGDQSPAPEDRCSNVRMNITINKNYESRWQVHIVVDSFR